MPRVSVITINYNQSSITLDLIASLELCSFQDFEIIVIDNASPSDSPELITEKYPDVNLIKSKKNLGFAGGNNLGIKQAKGDYLLFINNDVEVERDFFEPLVQELDNGESVGAVSPKIYFYERGNTIQYAGSTEINPFTTRSSFLGYKKIDDGTFDNTITTHYAHGAGMMVRREAIEKAGLMPELYFLYYEELDWCNRIKEQGYSIKCVRKSIIHHKESMSVGKTNPMKTYFQTRNRVIYIRRNTKGVTLFISLVYFYIIAFPKNIITHFVKREFPLMRAYWRGGVWNIFNLNLNN